MRSCPIDIYTCDDCSPSKMMMVCPTTLVGFTVISKWWGLNVNQQDVGRTYCTEIGDVIQLPVWDLMGVLYRFISVPSSNAWFGSLVFQTTHSQAVKWFWGIKYCSFSRVRAKNSLPRSQTDFWMIWIMFIYVFLSGPTFVRYLTTLLCCYQW